MKDHIDGQLTNRRIKSISQNSVRHVIIHVNTLRIWICFTFYAKHRFRSGQQRKGMRTCELSRPLLQGIYYNWVHFPDCATPHNFLWRIGRIHPHPIWNTFFFESVPKFLIPAHINNKCYMVKIRWRSISVGSMPTWGSLSSTRWWWRTE